MCADFVLKLNSWTITIEFGTRHWTLFARLATRLSNAFGTTSNSQ
jgi:hypothetical protein